MKVECGVPTAIELAGRREPGSRLAVTASKDCGTADATGEVSEPSVGDVSPPGHCARLTLTLSIARPNTSNTDARGWSVVDPGRLPTAGRTIWSDPRTRFEPGWNPTVVTCRI
jgi:hypothetical protein